VTSTSPAREIRRVKFGVEYWRGSAVELHRLAIDEVVMAAMPLVRVLVADRPAIILGSSQSDAVVDTAACTRLGVEIGRRRTGGGAVLVVPGQMVWVDVLVATAGPPYVDDLRLMAQWLGSTWVRAIGAGDVHRGGLEADSLGSTVCFAGLGPGEVSVEGRKVVGISQRRTRRWVLMQSAVLGRWDPASIVELLKLDDGERAVKDLAHRAGSVALAGLTDRFVGALADQG
jgi:lipoate---protein ligase